MFYKHLILWSIDGNTFIFSLVVGISNYHGKLKWHSTLWPSLKITLLNIIQGNLLDINKRACIVIVISFHWYHIVILIVTFDLIHGEILKTFYHMFFRLWSEILLFHNLI